MRKKGEWIYTGKRSQDLRDVTAKIRAIELFNPDGLRHPLSPTVCFVNHPCSLASRACPYGSHLLRRPRILRPACCLCPSSLFDLSFFRRRVLFLSRLSPSLGARSVSFILRRHPRPHPPILHPLTSPVRPPLSLPDLLALLSRRPCSRFPTLFATPRRSIIPQSRGV